MESAPQLPRLTTGILGLDIVLRGGFVQNNIHLLSGSPGAGKTVIANQISFHHVATGGRVVYVTLMSETHAHMFNNLQTLNFFNRVPINETIHYFSGAQVLEDEGLPGLLKFLYGVVREQKATLLIIDTLVTAEMMNDSDFAFRSFINQLATFLESANCTAIILTSYRQDSRTYPKNTMVDSLINLTTQQTGLTTLRRLEVQKARGSGFLDGQHFFKITENGVVVYPRLEAIVASISHEEHDEVSHLQFEITQLDKMLHGGLLSGSTTMLLGVPGSGKTSLGLHFLSAGARRDEPGLYFGFYETPKRLIRKANSIGLDFSAHIDHNIIEVIHHQPFEVLLDALADELLSAVARRSVRRLFIDSFTVFGQAPDFSERLATFFRALTDELRAANVTTLFSVEMATLVSPTVEIPLVGTSAIADNILLTRYVELHSQLYRLISIIKMRESDYEGAIREFKITPDGIQVANTFDSAHAILTGAALPVVPAVTTSSLPQDNLKDSDGQVDTGG